MQHFLALTLAKALHLPEPHILPGKAGISLAMLQEQLCVTGLTVLSLFSV